MSNKENKPLMPKLRFSAFKNSPEWTSEKVDRLVDTITPPKKLPTSSYAVNGDFPIIDQSQNAICGWTDDREALIKDDLPLIIFGDHTCILKLLDRPFAQGADGIKILKPRPRIGTSYLYQYLSYRPVVTEEYKRHYSILKEKVVLFPDFKTGEQQKIADCLSSLDELIVAQARKVDALKTHKKGLMQQLFPREGETQPRLRFLEFRDAGEWEDQSIGNIGKVVTGSTPSTAQPAFYGGGIPFVSPADISDMRFVDQTKTTLTQEGYAQTRPIRAGSVLFVCIGSTIGKVAQNIHDCATNQQINAIIPNSKHSEGFVYFALSLASERIALLAGRQAVPIINKSLFSSVRILVPKLPEQHRIASFLSSIETLLTDENQSLELLKAHKKGLMQQIFPSLESISA